MKCELAAILPHRRQANKHFAVCRLPVKAVTISYRDTDGTEKKPEHEPAFTSRG